MKEKRNISGIYFRVKRNDKWDNVCFEDLTEKEQDDILKSKSKEWVDGLAKSLSDTINEIANQFNICKD